MFITYLILALIFGIIVAVFCREDLSNGNTTKGRAQFFLASGIVGVVMSLILWFLITLASILMPIPVSEYTLENMTPIYALEDNHYLAFRRSNDSSGEVLYMVEEEFGFQTKTVENSSEEVFFKTIENEETPCLETYLPVYKKGFWDFFINTGLLQPSNRRYVFKVPENSIKQDYNIDLQ